MNEKEIVLETLFLPTWNTTALICEGGNIYIMLAVGRYYSRESFLKECEGDFNVKMIKARIDLFTELQNYYLEKYCNK